MACGECGILLQIRGSVLPRAFVWALASVVISYASFSFLRDIGGDFTFDSLHEAESINILWSTSQYILGFLIAFRAHQAYTRYVERVSLLGEMRTEWFQAISGIMAFSDKVTEEQENVERFQHFLVRLMSLLTCSILQSVRDGEDDGMAIIGLSGIDLGSLDFLQSKGDSTRRTEIIIQWIQNLVVDQAQKGVIKVHAAILSSFFQSIARGARCANRAKHLMDTFLPLSYALILFLLLAFHALVTPLLAGILMRSPIWAAAFSFISVFAFSSMHYTAIELESPLSDDRFGQHVESLQKDINASLWILLEAQNHALPVFFFDQSIHRRWSPQEIHSALPYSLSSYHDLRSDGGTRTAASKGKRRWLRHLFARRECKASTRHSIKKNSKSNLCDKDMNDLCKVAIAKYSLPAIDVEDPSRTDRYPDAGPHMDDLHERHFEVASDERFPITPRLELPHDKPWRLPQCDCRVSALSRSGMCDTSHVSPSKPLSFTPASLSISRLTTPRKVLPGRGRAFGEYASDEEVYTHSLARVSTPPMTDKVLSPKSPLPMPRPMPSPYVGDPQAASSDRAPFAARVRTPTASRHTTPRRGADA
jgi:predicted membrane chloride channel (bestrophin family)